MSRPAPGGGRRGSHRSAEPGRLLLLSPPRPARQVLNAERALCGEAEPTTRRLGRPPAERGPGRLSSGRCGPRVCSRRPRRSVCTGPPLSPPGGGGQRSAASPFPLGTCSAGLRPSSRAPAAAPRGGSGRSSLTRQEKRLRLRPLRPAPRPGPAGPGQRGFPLVPQRPWCGRRRLREGRSPRAQVRVGGPGFPPSSAAPCGERRALLRYRGYPSCSASRGQKTEPRILVLRMRQAAVCLNVSVTDPPVQRDAAPVHHTGGLQVGGGRGGGGGKERCCAAASPEVAEVRICCCFLHSPAYPLFTNPMKSKFGFFKANCLTNQSIPPSS